MMSTYIVFLLNKIQGCFQIFKEFSNKFKDFSSKKADISKFTEFSKTVLFRNDFSWPVRTICTQGEAGTIKSKLIAGSVKSAFLIYVS